MTQLFRTWVDLPPRVLHPNRKVASVGAARARAAAADAYKRHVGGRTVGIIAGGFPPNGATWCVYIADIAPNWHAVEARLTFHFPRKARRDTDNLDGWAKYIWDGLVLGGLLIDDDKITKHPTRIVIDPEDYAGAVCVEVWPVNGTAV